MSDMGRILTIPNYDPAALSTGIVHLGFGAFHRAHQSLYFDMLAEQQGGGANGIACVNLRGADSERFTEMTTNLPYVLRSIASDGKVEDRLIRVHTQALDWAADAQRQSAETILAEPGVQMVTMTVSEAGYYLDGEGDLETHHPVIQAEISGVDGTTVFAYLRAGLNARRLANSGPITVACCDNIRGNGHMLAKVFRQYLTAVGDNDLLGWLDINASFPNSMVDRITPKPPHFDVSALSAEVGMPLGELVVAEDFVQWVIEDDFAGTKPELAEVGVTVTANVEPYEETKIRVLNGGHTALTYMGALAGYDTYDAAFTATELNQHFVDFERSEVLPNLPTDLPFDADEYLDTIARRFRNRNIGDTVQRICSDGFAKFPIFIRPTMEETFQRGETPVHSIRSVASWVVFARRVFNQRMQFDYVEPNRERLMPLVQDESLDSFVASEPLWGDMSARFPEFKTELQRQVREVEAAWPV